MGGRIGRRKRGVLGQEVGLEAGLAAQATTGKGGFRGQKKGENVDVSSKQCLVYNFV